MSGHDGQDPALMDRRAVLSGLGAGIAAGFLASIPDQEHHSNDLDKDAHPDITDGYGEHPEIDVVEHGEVVEDPGLIERIKKAFDGNLISALPVVGMFGRQIKKNIAEGPNHRDFGKASWFEMLSVEAPRLAALSVVDTHQFDHEAKDIAISYALMGVLTSAAEATEHAEADEAAIFKRQFLTILEGIEEKMLEIQMPERDASKSEWDHYVSHKREQVEQIASQNLAIGTILAPLATTYTSATLSNAIIPRMGQALVELKYASKIAEHKVDNNAPISDEIAVELMTNAAAETDEAINGNTGYVKLLLATAANAQGAALVGDPPNWFYALRNGPINWAEASAKGFVAANLNGFAMTKKWLASNSESTGPLGLTEKSFYNTLKTIGATVKSAGFFDQSLRRNKRISDAIHEQLKEFDPNDPNSQKIADLVQGMNRSPFTYDFKGLRKAFKSSRMGRVESAGEITADTIIESQFRGERLDAGTMKLLTQMLKRADNPTAGVNVLIDEIKERKGNRLAVEAAKVLTDAALGRELDEDQRLFLAGLNLVDGDYQVDPQGEKAEQIRNAIENGDIDDVDVLLAEISDKVSFMPEDTMNAVRLMWAKLTDADSIDPNHEIGGLGHASKEVLSALATQILAANAAATAAKKALDILGDNSIPGVNSFDLKKALVLSLAEGLSAVADNVVAYIFAEDVLKDLYKKEFGDDVFEGNNGKALDQAVTSSALFVAVAGGAFTKIGNGPNFKYEWSRIKIVDGKLVAQKTEREQILLKDSTNNPWAWTNGVLALGGSLVQMHLAEKRIDRIDDGNDQALTSRRQFIRRGSMVLSGVN